MFVCLYETIRYLYFNIECKQKLECERKNVAKIIHVSKKKKKIIYIFYIDYSHIIVTKSMIKLEIND